MSIAAESRSPRASTSQPRPARHQPGCCAATRPSRRRYPKFTRTSYSVLGPRKMHVMWGRPEIAKRHDAGHVAGCTVARLVTDLGVQGVRRAKSPRTTRSAPGEQCSADLVRMHFSTFRPNELWVANITYVRTFSGVSLRRLHRRRVLAENHRLADIHQPVHRPGL